MFQSQDPKAPEHISPKRLPAIRFALIGSLTLTALAIPQLSFACAPDAIRYAATSNRVYIEKPVECTLTDLAAKVKKFVLNEVEPGVWEIYTNLFVTNGGTLNLVSRAKGGDVDVLRLKSNPGVDAIIHMEINYGQLNVDGIQITSWDTLAQAPDNAIEDGRAYIKARSFKDKYTGEIKESTVNILNSELMNLGYQANESYGLALKVKAKRDEQYLFDEIDIFGSLINNNIHHNYMGFYSWGAYGLEIRDNEVHNNILYGIDPHDHSDSLVIENNYVHDNGSHGIICSTDCKDLVIRNNLVERNRHGIMLHQNVTQSLVEGNTLRDNREVGVALYNSHNNLIENNISTGNTDGIRLSSGSSDNRVSNNFVEGNTRYSLYMYQGSSLPPDTDGRNRRNVFASNTLGANAAPVKIRSSDATRFEDNTFISPLEMILKDTRQSAFAADNLYPAGSSISSDSNFQLGLAPLQSLTVVHPDNELFLGGAPFNTRSYPSIAKTNETRLHLRNPSPLEDVNVLMDEQRIKVTPNENYLRAQPVSNKAYPGKGVELRSAFLDQESRLEFAALQPNTYYDLVRIHPNSAEAAHPIIHQRSNSSGRLTVNVPLHKSGYKLEFHLTQSAQQNGPYVANALRDSYVRDGSQSGNNFSNATQLAVKTDPYTRENTRIAYMSFDLSQLSSINQATLELQARLHIPGAVEVAVMAVEDSSWRETQITWDKRPALGETLGTSTVDSTSFSTKTLDLTSYLQAQKAQGKNIASVALVSNTPSHAIVYLQSKEWDSYGEGQYAGALLKVTP